MINSLGLYNHTGRIAEGGGTFIVGHQFNIGIGNLDSRGYGHIRKTHPGSPVGGVEKIQVRTGQIHIPIGFFFYIVIGI